MSSPLTWLHLSDTHIGNTRHRWDSDRIMKGIPSDLRTIQQNHDIRPDFVFFTGDIAFGEVSGSPLTQQYDEVLRFLDSVKGAFSPPISCEAVFLVPGNHDVNRAAATPDQAEWLDALIDAGSSSVSKIADLMRSGNRQWERYMERLSEYGSFLQRGGFTHLLEDPDRLIYAIRRNVRGVEVGIAGLNSAWSACRDQEKAKLWLGSWQISTLAQRLDGAAVSIVLSHHPINWLNEHEDPSLGRELAKRFDFHVHGHEHDEWVRVDDGHVRVAAGACYESPGRESGYNIVRVFPHERIADIHLRTYDRRGEGWIQHIIHGKTSSEGVWRVSNPRLFVGDGSARGSAGPIAQSMLGGDPAAVWQPVDGPIDVFSYFSPASEIDVLERFVGRRDELRMGVEALRTDGASVAIFGNAGVGKTSLAIQLARIASGNEDAFLAKAGLNDLRPKNGFRHPVVFYTCRQADSDIDGVLLSLLRDLRPPSSLGSLLESEQVKSLFAGRHARLAEQLAAIAEVEREPGGGRPKSALVAGVFSNVVQLVFEAFGRQSLVIVLDEFDKVNAKYGLAELIKEMHYVKWILIGTAADVRLLIQDHSSVPRQFTGGQIRVHRMTEEELRAILIGEENRSGKRFRFSPDAIRTVVRSSRGMPYFTHFLGRSSLAEAVREHGDAHRGTVIVGEGHVHEALQCRLKDLADLDMVYLDIVRPSLTKYAWKREIFLKLLSWREEDDIVIGNLAGVAATQGIRSVAAYAKKLVSLDVLEQTGAGSYRFKDIRLKVFARLRDVICDQARPALAHLTANLDAVEGWSVPNRLE